MFLLLALFIVTPNLEGTFRMGKNPTSLTIMLNLTLFCFLDSILKEHISLRVYKYWFEPETLLWVVL